MNITSLLPAIKRPSRYLGTETNARRKPWSQAELRMALIFPDLYEIGMSHLGLQILYHIINDLDWALADRAYCPDLDMERAMRQKGMPAWGIESGKPLKDFDIVAFTLPYELCYSNILTILNLAGIPFFQHERSGKRYPLILGGGSCSLNPEPVADFFDAILVGDGEEAIIEIAEAAREWKQERNAPRINLLERLASIKGIYVPSFYRAGSSQSGFAIPEPVHPAAGTVQRRIVPRLDKVPFPEKPLVPYMQIVHDRLGIEIARGCTRGCRFCQAGIIYRPVRERPPEQILAMAESGLLATGWDELSLLSLSTGDYSCLFELIHELMKRQREEHVSISLPSLRVGTLTEKIMEEIKSVRKTGFTLAPEAGSERLRQVINKGISEQDLLETAALAYAHGWSHMKLYFMTGLPTETEEDVDAIAELARKVQGQGAVAGRTGGRRGKRQVTVSVGTFVPKPHTPFQWEAQIDTATSRQRINRIRQLLRGKAFNVKWHEPRQSFLEGIFSRGDRRLSRVLVRAWKAGARLDGWTDCMKAELYEEAAEGLGIELEHYLKARDIDEALPWGHISSGVDPAYIIDQRTKAFQGIYTPDCRNGRCHKCGVCDFKELRPVTFKGKHKETEPVAEGRGPMAGASAGKFLNYTDRRENAREATRHFCRITYSKLAPAHLLGHLEMAHAFHRAARRSRLPVSYSTGFHPMPRVAFGPPLSLGIESLLEEAVMELDSPMSGEHIISRLNMALPEGISVNDATFSNTRIRIKPHKKDRYIFWLPGTDAESIRKNLHNFMELERFEVERKRKKKVVTVDARAQTARLEILAGNQGDSREAVPEPGQPEHEWLEAKRLETGHDGSVLLLEMYLPDGPGLKPHEIVSLATGLGTDRPPQELFELMRVLKCVPH